MIFYVAGLAAFIILFMLVSACVVFVSEVIGSISDFHHQRWLSRRTERVRIRDAMGVVTKKRYHANHFDVTVRIGKRTYFTTDDEDAFYTLHRGDNTTVRIREHINMNNKVFYRALVEIILPLSQI